MSELTIGAQPRRFSSGDVIAGLSVALILVPQAMAYAEIAGVPSYIGLYAAALPPLVAAFFASSPYLQTGPVAMTSLLTFSALAGLATAFTPEYVEMAALLAIVVGVIRVLLGLLRAGVASYLMSQPVMLGFTSAAAILISASQFPKAVGGSPPEGGLLYQAGWSLIHPGSWEITSLVLSIVAAVVIVGGRRVSNRFPGVLAAVVIALAYSVVTGYDGPVVGDIPTGLPPLSLALPWGEVPALLLDGLVIALIGFAEPSAIARRYATQDRQRWSPDREFVSQGMANVASGISGGFPVGGSFSRSSVTRLAGGRTRWSGAVTGLAVLAFLPIADVLSPLPSAILGAIVIVAVIRLIDIRGLIRIIGSSKPQALVAMSTFILTLVLEPHLELGILFGVGLGIAVHVWRELSTRIHTEFDVDTLQLTPIGVLFFGSSPALEEALIGELAAHPEARRVVLDLHRLGRVDYTGALALKSLADDARAAGLAVDVVGVPPQARRVLTRVWGGKLTSTDD